VPRPIQQIITQQSPNISQDFRITRGMKTMTAVVDSHFCQVEAAGVAANMAILFQDAHSSERATPQLKRRAEARRAGPQDHNVRSIHEFKNAKGLLMVSGALLKRQLENYCVRG
jgi:hypothetical protein